MSNQFGTPTLARLALGALITRIRDEAGLTVTQLAAALGVDPDTVRRWERGQIAPRKIAIAAIARETGASPEQLSRMTALSLDSKKKGLFEGANVPPDLRVLYETEATARHIASLELEHVPGLLQTPEYHLAVQECLLPVNAEFGASLRALRTRRQEIVFGRHPLPRLRFLLGPASLLYLDGLPRVRDAQIARLREASVLPGVEIKVIPALHAAMLGSFTILTPPSVTGARPFVYVEDIDGGRYVEGDVVSQYEAVYRMVWDRQSVDLEDYLR